MPIFNMAGGNSGGVNFTVKGGTTAPTAKENTVWVKTDKTVTGWVFSSNEPETISEGLVWFRIGEPCETPLNALHNNAIKLSVNQCVQYVSGARQFKEVQLYYSGQWLDWVEAGLQLSALDEGSVVLINEDGEPVEYILLKHDYESDLNGAGRTLFRRKKAYAKRTLHSSKVNDYLASDAHNILNTTFKSTLDAATQKAIEGTTIEYALGNSTSKLTTNADVFLLSYYEWGKTSTEATQLGEIITAAQDNTVVSFEGATTAHWTRTPNNTNTTSMFYMSTTQGGGNSVSVTTQYGIVPAFAMPDTMLVSARTDASGRYTLLT